MISSFPSFNLSFKFIFDIFLILKTQVIQLLWYCFQLICC